MYLRAIDALLPTLTIDKHDRSVRFALLFFFFSAGVLKGSRRLTRTMLMKSTYICRSHGLRFALHHHHLNVMNTGIMYRSVTYCAVDVVGNPPPKAHTSRFAQENYFPQRLAHTPDLCGLCYRIGHRPRLRKWYPRPHLDQGGL